MQAPAFSASNLKIACANCNLRELCLPVGLSISELDKVEATSCPAPQGQAR